MEETIVLLNLLGTLHDSSTIPKYVGNFEKYSLEEISRRLERVEYDESMMNFIGLNGVLIIWRMIGKVVYWKISVRIPWDNKIRN